MKNLKNKIYPLDLSWINSIQVNLSAIERRTNSLVKRRSVKKDYQAAWLLKAITLIDLTTLSGDDTFGKIDHLCHKALNPLAENILESLKFCIIKSFQKNSFMTLIGNPGAKNKTRRH